MLQRRNFIKNTIVGLMGFSFLKSDSLAILTRAKNELDYNSENINPNEKFWLDVRSAFHIDDKIINLNNAGISPTPRIVHDRFKGYLDKSNLLPAYYNWQELEPEKEQVRIELGKAFGVNPEEIAITRNASEALQNVQFGLDLLEGDEVITTDQDYFRMLNTWKQIERRKGIKTVIVNLPMPWRDEDFFIKAVEKSITNRTKIIHISHLVYLTGQILPVKKISDVAHKYNIKLICDGAQSFFHFPFEYKDIDSDFYGTSLHKWCYAPIGTGFLHVRKELISRVWPLMAAPAKMDDNIRKFEEIGTHPAANHNSILEAIKFNQKLGIQLKLKRLQELQNVWIEKLSVYPALNILTNRQNINNWGGIVLFNIEGINTSKLYKYLLDEMKIFTAPMIHTGFEGIRISPNIYNSIEEMKYFTDGIERVILGKVNEVKN